MILEPFNAGIHDFHDLIDIEKQLVSDNPSQVQRLENIEILFDEWKTKAAQPEIAVARDYFESFGIESNTAEFSNVSQLLKNKTGKDILDNIRDEFTLFIQIENELKDERLSNVSATSIFTETLLILFSVSIAAIVGLIAFVFTQSISRPLEILKQASVKVSGGQLDTKIKQVTLDKRKIKSVDKSRIKPIKMSGLISFKNKIFVGFLGLSFLIGIIGLIGYIEITEVQDDLTYITDFQTPALIKLSEMKAVTLEGIEEAFAYPLLDAVIEKEEFYENMNHFDLLAKEFAIIAHIDEDGEEIETELFYNIISNKEKLVDSATLMFENYEKVGKIDVQYLELFEENIDTTIPLIDEFIAIEIKEVDEAHRHAQENINAAFLTLPVIVLFAVMISIFGGIVVSRTIIEPVVIISSTGKQLQEDSSISSSGDEIKELSDTFNTMVYAIKVNTELEKNLAVEKEKVKNAKINALGNVTSNLAHNLKNPLSVIKATTSIIEATSNSVDEKTRERLNLIKISTENMLNQIEDMLDFVKQKPLELQETSLSEILNTAINNIKKPERIKINLPENDIKIKCDSAKLQVVFMNLMTNSIESVNGKGEITINSYQNNRETMIEIIDTGSINPDDLEKMFDVLYTTKPTGTGLGLPYCKSVIEQHGGNIEVSMNPTKFTIIIPH